MILLENEYLSIIGTEDDVRFSGGVAKVTIVFKKLEQEMDWFEVRDLYCNLNEWLVEYAHLAGEKK